MADVETWGWRAIQAMIWLGIGFSAVLAVAGACACVIGAFFLWGALVAA